MNALDFMPLFLLVALLSCWIHGGIPDVLPPERCYLVHLNVAAPYHQRNKQPTTENLKQIIPVLSSPYNLTDFPELTCKETAVTLKSVTFSSNRNHLQTKLDVWFKVEPHKNVAKLLAYHCAENMLYQGSHKVNEVEPLLGLCKDKHSISAQGCYHIDQKSCCEEQYLYEEPCCRPGYTLKNLICLKKEMKKDNEKGELMKMEKETGDDCEPSGPKLSIGIIIIIASGCLILLVTIVLAGVRILKKTHRPNRSGYNDVAEVITSDIQPEERRATGESSVRSAAVAVEEETKDGYMKMQNLSKTNLFIQHDTTQTTTNNTNNCTLTPTTNDQQSSEDSLRRTRVRSLRPPSRSEMMFDFDKYVPIEAIDFTNKMLGRGQFGQVELAYVTIKGLRKKCAVKMIRGMGTHDDERELFEELQMLYQIPYHPNVVSLLGACFGDNSPLYVIVEYCANGSLLKYLQNNRETSHDYVNFSSAKMDFRWKLHRAMEICKGMIFLGQRQIIHRDLAARNILLDDNEVAKISDFGMAKDVYLRGLYIKETATALRSIVYHTKEFEIAGFLPLRWMAIEAIESRIYTIKSDMWSFGILIWEMYMDGLIPYPGVTDGNDLLEKYLKKGFRMMQPENCPDSFYHLMERCWLAKPEDRPSFTQALRDLEIIKDEEMRRESEASKITEVSDTCDLPVFEDEAPQESSKSTHTNQQERQEDVQMKQPPHKENAENDTAKTGDPIDIGIVNRGRSSIDSGTDVKLPCSFRKNSDEQISYF